MIFDITGQFTIKTPGLSYVEELVNDNMLDNLSEITTIKDLKYKYHSCQFDKIIYCIKNKNNYLFM
jgi:hypothetical protein